MSAVPQHLLRAHAPPPRAAALSDRLLDPLHLVTSRARLLAILKALFQFIATAAATWLLLILLLGSIHNLPVFVAIALTLIAWLTIIAAAIFFFRPALRRRDLSSAARMVDAATPDAHERVSSALELTAESDPRFLGSAELIDALVRQAEHTAESIDPLVVVSGRTVFRWFLSLIPLILIWFVLLVVLTPTISRGFQRLMQPWTPVTPLPTARLDVDPQDITIAQGESVTINLAVTPVSALAAPDKRIDHATITRHFPAGGANEDITSDMESTGNRTFRAIFDNVQQSFSYSVNSENSQSPAYSVTVQPRPAANSIQIDYAYPAYTHRAAHTDTSRDGSIDAVVGTRVTLTIDSSQPLKSASFSITDNTPDPSTINLAPLAGSPSRFAGQFTIKKSTDYRLHLINPQDLDNSDKQPRPIIARLDTPPQISITSPSDGSLKVRPDDSVPVKYTATDDFGLTRVELITQVDNDAPITTPLPLTANQTNLTGSTALAVHDLLSGLPATPAPKRIAYQLRATDNRDPDPQTGLSIKQVLLIDRGVAPLAARQDEQAAHTLAEAITQSTADLDDAKNKLDTLRQTAATRPLTDAEKQQAADARRDLTNAGQILQSAADKSSDSRLADSAKQAKAIADQPIRQAQENTAAGQLAADQPDARNKSLDAANQNITDARQKLDALARDVNNKAKDQPLAHELERIAAEQRRLADALAQNPNDPKLLAQQRQLQQDLEKLIADHPELQKPAADAAQAKADDLSKQLHDLQQAQQPLNDNAKNQTDAAHIQDKLNDLAKQQDDLNQKIQQFNQQQAEALKRTGSKTPDPSQTDPIVKDLQSKKLANAGQAQNAAASQLEETAKQLEAADKHSPDAAPDRPVPTAKDAAALQDRAAQLQKQIDDAQKSHDPPTRPSDPANQEAAKLADQVHRQAQQLSQSSASRQAAKQAMDEADAAKRDAAAGNAQSAQQHLTNATSALADAAKANQPAATPSNPSQPSASAAEQARSLAQQQRALADQTTQTDKSLDSAATARNNAQQSADQQQKLADQMEQAAKSAKELAQQTKGAAPEMSQRAAQSAQALQKAADAQRAAAQSTQSGNNSQAASQQKQASDALSSAQQSMPSPPAQSNGTPSASASSGSEKPGGSASKSGSGTPSQSANSPSGNAAAQAVQSARNAQSQAASGNPAAARQAADQLSQASQQLLTGDGQESPGGSPSTSGSPSGNSPDAKPAASGSAMATATPSPGAPGTSGPTPGKSAGGPSGSGPGIGGGIALSDRGQSVPTPLPKSVEDIGLSPSDWARLPPNTQQQLLNSAQQSGPPAYRDMIKNYYSRIAHLDDPAAGGAQ